MHFNVVNDKKTGIKYNDHQFFSLIVSPLVSVKLTSS